MMRSRVKVLKTVTASCQGCLNMENLKNFQMKQVPPTAQSFPYFRMGLRGPTVIFNLPLGRFFLFVFSGFPFKHVRAKKEKKAEIVRKRRKRALQFVFQAVAYKDRSHEFSILVDIDGRFQMSCSAFGRYDRRREEARRV